MGNLWVHKDYLYIRVVNPNNFLDNSFRSLDRTREHLSNLPCIHKINTMYNQSYSKRFSTLISVLRLNSRVKWLVKNVDFDFVIEVLNNLLFETLLFMQKLARKLSHNDGKHNVETSFTKQGFFNDFLVSWDLEQIIVEILLIVLI